MANLTTRGTWDPFAGFSDLMKWDPFKEAGYPVFRQYFERHIAAKLLVLCLIYFTHPAFANLTNDLIVA